MHMLIFALTVALALLSFSRARATIVNVDLNDLTPSGNIFCSGYCGYGPEYTYFGNPGDVVNFGTVTMLVVTNLWSAIHTAAERDGQLRLVQ
jgi:hypothetical protein